MTALSFVFVPIWSWCWSYVADALRFPGPLHFMPIDANRHQFLIRIDEARRMAVSRNNKVAYDVIERRVSEIEKATLLRRTTAALLMAAAVNGLFVDGLIRVLKLPFELHPWWSGLAVCGFVPVLV